MREGARGHLYSDSVTPDILNIALDPEKNTELLYRKDDNEMSEVIVKMTK